MDFLVCMSLYLLYLWSPFPISLSFCLYPVYSVWFIDSLVLTVHYAKYSGQDTVITTYCGQHSFRCSYSENMLVGN